MNKNSPIQPTNYRLRQQQAHRHYSTFARYSEISRLVANRLLERFDLVQIEPEQILDLACVDGFSTEKIEKRFKKSRLIGIDAIPVHVQHAAKQSGWFKKRRFLAAQEHALPLEAKSMDCIYSNLLPTWHISPQAIFSSCKQAIKDNGLILFSTLGPDSLKEMTQAWQTVDPEFRHSHQFIDMHDIGDALSRNGFSGIVMESEPLVIEYDSIDELHADLRYSGQANLHPDRRKTLLGKDRYECYRKTLKSSEGKLRITLEIVYGHAWAGFAKAKIPEHDFGAMVQEIPTIKVD